MCDIIRKSSRSATPCNHVGERSFRIDATCEHIRSLPELWFQQLEKTEACQISNSFKIHAFTLARIGLPWTYKVEDFRRTTCLLSLSSVHDWTLSSKLTAIFRAIKALVLHTLSSKHCLAVQQLIKIPKPQINLQLAVQKWLPGLELQRQEKIT